MTKLERAALYLIGFCAGTIAGIYLWAVMR